jgi:hypothetical protein
MVVPLPRTAVLEEEEPVATGASDCHRTSGAASVISGGGHYAAGGINLLSLEDLVEGMKSTFRVVRGKHHQANGGGA